MNIPLKAEAARFPPGGGGILKSSATTLRFLRCGGGLMEVLQDADRVRILFDSIH